MLAAATRHGITPLVFSNLARCPSIRAQLPADVAHAFRAAGLRSKVVKEQRWRALAPVLDFCDAHGIRVMLVKGAALDCTVYQTPWLTTSHDIDVVLDATDPLQDETAAELKQLCWDVSQRAAIEFEWGTHHDVTMNGVLPVCFQAIWRDACPVAVQGRRLWVMSAEDLLIAASINLARRRFLKLKALVDVAEAAATVDWSKVVAKSRTYRCTRMVYAALHAVRQVLDASVPDSALEALGTAGPRGHLIRRLCRRLRRTIVDTDPATRRPTPALLLTYATFHTGQLCRNLAAVARARGKFY